MDDEEIDAATRRWVAADLIDEETAAAIRAFEGDGSPSADPDRLTGVVAVMGALLIGVGLLAAIGAIWDSLGTVTKTILVVAAPVLAGGSGLTLDRRGLGGAGLGLWILAALLVGPSLFMLASIHEPGYAPHWLFLAWGTIALPMAHAFRTRIGTAVGLITLLVAVTTAAELHSGIAIAGILGTVIVAASIPLRDRAPELVPTYRTLGLAPALAALLWLTVAVGIFENLELEVSIAIGVALVVSIAATGTIWRWETTSRAVSGETALGAIPLVASTLGVAVALIAGAIPSILGFLLVHGVLLGSLIAIAVVGLHLSSTWLVNLVALGFLLQVLSLLARMTNEFSGALALIAAGVVLLLVAVALERGRRRILTRLGGHR